MDQLKIMEMCIRGGRFEATAGQGVGVAGLSVRASVHQGQRPPRKLVLYLCVHGVVRQQESTGQVSVWSFLAGKNIVGNIITFMAFLQKCVLGISFAFSVKIGFLSKELSR